MSETLQYIKILREWSSEPCTKIITDVLLRIQHLKSTESPAELNSLLETLGSFHKQANKADASKVEEVWFKEVIKCKNHIKALLEKSKKESVKLPKLIKSNSNIEYPEEEMKERSEKYKLVMRSLYKHFLINMQEDIQKDKQKITDFLDQVISHVFDEFGFDKDTANQDENQTSKMLYRIETIYKQLAKSSSTLAKKQMLQGKSDPEKVARLDPKAFVSQEAQRLRQQRLDAIAKENQTGFYDELKKNINKDANQECRFCHKPTAYCEAQKQIRASDEPMTRFMVCNTCGRRWKQQ